MPDHILLNSGDAVVEIVALAVLRAVEAMPGACPRLHDSSDDEQIATALAVLSEAGFVEDYELTTTGREFLRSLSDT